eukprot:scaffold76828_cov30-Attheya_sp.AAC.1
MRTRTVGSLLYIMYCYRYHTATDFDQSVFTQLIITVEELNDCINKAGASVIPDKNRKQKDWFRTAADYLIPAIDIRNEAFQKWSNDPTEPNRANYKTKRNKLINRLKRQAIGRWMKKIASECDESHIEGNPKRAWE